MGGRRSGVSRVRKTEKRQQENGNIPSIIIGDHSNHRVFCVHNYMFVVTYYVVLVSNIVYDFFEELPGLQDTLGLDKCAASNDLHQEIYRYPRS
jgi:hypothetical protein